MVSETVKSGTPTKAFLGSSASGPQDTSRSNIISYCQNGQLSPLQREYGDFKLFSSLCTKSLIYITYVIGGVLPWEVL